MCVSSRRGSYRRFSVPHWASNVLARGREFNPRVFIILEHARALFTHAHTNTQTSHTYSSINTRKRNQIHIEHHLARNRNYSTHVIVWLFDWYMSTHTDDVCYNLEAYVYVLCVLFVHAYI